MNAPFEVRDAGWFDSKESGQLRCCVIWPARLRDFTQTDKIDSRDAGLFRGITPANLACVMKNPVARSS
jgi:hypothetical protein